MILDCFMFYNEYDLLENRLEYLYNHVDYFIISEANVTCSGRSKEYNFSDHAYRYRKYLDKIVYLHCDLDQEEYVQKDGDTENSWSIDNIQRNYLLRGIQMFPLNSIVMISDVDEIPLHSSISFAVPLIRGGVKELAFRQDMFYYNFNWQKADNWIGTVATNVKTCLLRSPQYFRDNRWDIYGNSGIVNGGYHLSYWNTAEEISNKIKNFAHQELNTEEFTDTLKIQEKIDNGIDLYSDGELRPYDKNLIDKQIYNIFNK